MKRHLAKILITVIVGIPAIAFLYGVFGILHWSYANGRVDHAIAIIAFMVFVSAAPPCFVWALKNLK